MASYSSDSAESEENWKKNLLDEDGAKGNDPEPKLENQGSGNPASGCFDNDIENGIKNLQIKDDDEMEFIIPEDSATGVRTHALWNFCKFVNGPGKPDMEGLPMGVQEQIVSSELLYVLVGMRGSLIEPKNDTESQEFPLTFKICESIHPSLREMLHKILPLASYYICVQKFVEKAQEDNAGTVLQALSAALGDMVRDYYQVIAQMEDIHMDGDLSLHKVMYILRSVSKNMEAIVTPLMEIMSENIRGGRALTLLYNTMEFTIDEDSQAFLGVLLQNAAVPYMHTMDLWLESGSICDSSNEFFIEDIEQSGTRKLPDPSTLDYWDERFFIKYDTIPKFLKELALKILKTGKYLNLLYKLGKKLETKKLHLKFIPGNKEYATRIIECYHTASSSLLTVIFKECHFFIHLRSVKHFLLLSHSDFMKSFLDACDDELSQKSHDISSLKVLTILQAILGETSSLQDDPNKNLVSCTFCLHDISTQIKMILNCGDKDEDEKANVNKVTLNGYQSLAFDYVAPWPMSMVMNDFTISKYQMIFRLLFYIKHVENELCKTWTENPEIKGKAYFLRYQLLNAIQNFGYYITTDVIEPSWITFMEQIKKAIDFDELLEAHNHFLDVILHNCLLTDMINFIDDMMKICNKCLDFCKIVANQDEKVNKPELIDLLAKDFQKTLVTFLKDLRAFSNLAERIDFNNYYKKLPKFEEENKQHPPEGETSEKGATLAISS